MLDAKTTIDLALRLEEAERTRTQLRQFTLDYPDLTIEDAYEIQRAWIALKKEQGSLVKGRKIGLTSRAMQRSSNINEPDYGTLMDYMFYPDGSNISANRFIMPRIELELAFILKDPLRGPNCTLFDVLSATDYVVPAIELIDARIEPTDSESGRTRKVMDTISDNAANAGVIMGGRPVKPMDFDLRWVSAICYRNGVVEDTGVAAAVLNHPANGPAWLANKLHAYDEELSAGDVILGGSFIAPVKVLPGDTIHADYGALGSIACKFV